MSEDIRMCVEKWLGPAEAAEANARAVEERPDNLEVVPLRPAVPAGTAAGTGDAGSSPPVGSPRPSLFGAPHPGERRVAAVLVTNTRWENGTTLKVRFLGGEDVVKRRIENVALDWSQHVNLKLEFGSDDDAQIRIGFDTDDGSWSYLGTDAFGIPDGSATMNYGWLTPDSGDEEYRRVVLHEFGHALGLAHEHQHPEVTIPWDEEKVYAYYRNTQGWSRADVDNNIFDRLSTGETQYSEFDPESIMLYPVSNALTVGDFEIGWNRELSDTDVEFVKTVAYPGRTPRGGDLDIDGPRVDATIGGHREVDEFAFEVTDAGRFDITTEGPTDVVMTLHGPDSPSALLAFDDDSGTSLNARIVRRLDPGTYWIRVRHYWPTGTGTYSVGVARRD